MACLKINRLKKKVLTTFPKLFLGSLKHFQLPVQKVMFPSYIEVRPGWSGVEAWFWFWRSFFVWLDFCLCYFFLVVLGFVFFLNPTAARMCFRPVLLFC